MSYNYEREKGEVFKEHNQEMFLRIRDGIRNTLKQYGALTVESAMSIAQGGDTYTMLACIDRLKEIGEICILDRIGEWSQFSVIVEPNPTIKRHG